MKVSMNESIKSQLEWAVRRTPSGDNCQPFSCSWEGECLRITHDEALASHRINHGNYASLITLGCLLENVRVVGLAHGLRSRVSLGENPLRECSLEFDICPKDESLLAAVSARLTDRRIFHQGWDEELSLLASERVSIIPRIPATVREFFLQCDGIFWDDKGIFFDTLKWVRFSEAQALRTKDGLPSKNLGISFTDSIALWFSSKSVVLQKLMGLFGGKFLGRRLYARQLDSAGGFVFIHAESTSAGSLVKAGQDGMRIWLELTRKNFSVQPLTIVTLLTFIDHHFGLCPDYPEKVKLLLHGGSELMKRELGLPIWGFRFGKVPTPYPTANRTLRRGN